MSCKQLLCRFYTQGTCNYGDSCIYSHNPDDSVQIPEDVCLFYLRSNCLYGENCTKKHKSINEILSPSVTERKSSTVLVEPVLYKASTSNPSKPVDNTKSKTYASAVMLTSVNNEDQNLVSRPICTFYESNGYCVFPNCSFIHGDMCDFCGFLALHPFNESQRKSHREECIKEHEKSMEISFAYQRSKDLVCGICLDVILEKEPLTSRRFGILQNCTHIYCIDCIRTWRKSENFDKKNKRGCPQCRVKSDYIIPSEYFYNDKSEKERLINSYRKALSSKHCQYFKKGEGKCPFEGACFYKHEYPDGRKAELPMPTTNRLTGDRGTNDILFFDDSLFSFAREFAFIVDSDLLYDTDNSSEENFADFDF